MHTIEFDSNTERALIRLAAHAGKDTDQLIKQAVSEFLGEQEDIAAADAAYLRYQAGQEKSLSLDELERQLGLDS